MTNSPEHSSVSAVGLFSGGLDSILAAHVLREQNIKITAVCFTSPFFSETRGVEAAEKYSFPFRVEDVSEQIGDLIANPPHGFGKAANPCIDCHAMMFREAGKIMETLDADFLFSGEVLNQRPMSQNGVSLQTVARSSGYADMILRPLSALKLPPTPVEKKGLVDRSRLFGIFGKSRTEQIELAQHFAITDYPQPAGGCLLTYKGFGKKVFDLRENTSLTVLKMQRLSFGRHFRIAPGIKLIMGKNQEDNEHVRRLQGNDILLECRETPGPISILTHTTIPEIIQTALDLCAFYSDAATGNPVRIHMSCGDKIDVYKVIARDCKKLREKMLLR